MHLHPVNSHVAHQRGFSVGVFLLFLLANEFVVPVVSDDSTPCMFCADGNPPGSPDQVLTGGITCAALASSVMEDPITNTCNRVAVFDSFPFDLEKVCSCGGAEGSGEPLSDACQFCLPTSTGPLVDCADQVIPLGTSSSCQDYALFAEYTPSSEAFCATMMAIGESFCCADSPNLIPQPDIGGCTSSSPTENLSPVNIPTFSPTGRPTLSVSLAKGEMYPPPKNFSPAALPTRGPKFQPGTIAPRGTMAPLPKKGTQTPTLTMTPTLTPTMTPTTPTGVYCIPDRSTLDDALDDYVLNNGALSTYYLVTYGPIENWCFASSLVDFSYLFSNSDFNGDISMWDVSNVQDMSGIFRGYNNAFNGDISTWDVSSVTDMSSMFSVNDAFNGDISMWDVSRVTDMSSMFDSNDAFNGDISMWDVSNVQDMNDMFAGNSGFNGDISMWDVSNVVDMNFMFYDNSVFNGDISMWDVSNVQDMGDMFDSNDGFNGDLSMWNVSSVTDMSFMFNRATNFNQNLCQWGSVIDPIVTTYITRPFSYSACPEQEDPNFTISPPGPFCYDCGTSSPTPSLIKIKLRNRQFESDSTAWKIITGTPERICNTGNEYSGDCCYAFTGSSSGEVQRIKNKVKDYGGGGQIGDKFQLTFWLKGEGVEKKRDFRIYLKLKGATGSRNLFCKSSKKGTFDYKKMLCEYEADEGFEDMDIIFEYQGTVGAVYLDRLALFQVV